MDMNFTSPTLTVDDLHKIREINYERTKNMSSKEITEFFHRKAEEVQEMMNSLKA